MSNKNFVICTCFRCKKNGTDNIGDYVHTTTKWRHSKRRKNNVGLNKLIDDMLIDDDDNIDYYDSDGRKDNDDSDKDYEVYNRLYSELINFETIVAKLFFYFSYDENKYYNGEESYNEEAGNGEESSYNGKETNDGEVTDDVDDVEEPIIAGSEYYY